MTDEDLRSFHQKFVIDCRTLSTCDRGPGPLREVRSDRVGGGQEDRGAGGHEAASASDLPTTLAPAPAAQQISILGGTFRGKKNVTYIRWNSATVPGTTGTESIHAIQGSTPLVLLLEIGYFWPPINARALDRFPRAAAGTGSTICSGIHRDCVAQSEMR